MDGLCQAFSAYYLVRRSSVSAAEALRPLGLTFPMKATVRLLFFR